MSKRAKQLRSTINLWNSLWWRLLSGICSVWLTLCYRIRTRGRHHIPTRGPILYVSNHQSFLDPIIVGLTINRPFFALARKTLFKNPAFAWLLRSLNTIAVDQESGNDKGAMRVCIEVLKNNESLLIFPEGSRTLDGKTQAFEPGMMLMIRRTKPTIIPIAIEGAFAAWPREGKFHITGRIRAVIGKPVCADHLLAMETDEALASLQQHIERMRLKLANIPNH